MFDVFKRFRYLYTMQLNSPMKNKKLEVIEFLNKLAEQGEEGILKYHQFFNQCVGVIELAAFQMNIDRIEQKLLIEQLMDIGHGKYTRFCEPELPEHVFANENECGYDLDTRNDPSLD